MQDLKNRYEQYLQEAEKARQKAGLCDGLFGMGNDPRKAPCHEAFYEFVAHWVGACVQTEGDCGEAAAWLLKIAEAHREEKDVFGYLYAAQGHALPLIVRMDREKAKELLCWYESAYPRRDRMPVQDEVYKALKKAARPKLW